ncbi:hypothetical protein ATI61_103271 [Archangium gephyra]|uniref:DUF2169 domain-containing protein n=1 Tax=Archangium gephyra TaxID=48 RepID=A0AAC8TD41_9BACT|nr:DUF2169 domain-containing protein [Archangium gephyra]AKJ01560.1 Hypothetical protein AA314_03186 [Archangium gephyra]REG34378.1 hypothetical protein ATI61_103271 [Archangium gephyra]
MLEVRNKTAFEVALVPVQDKQGDDYAVVVIKGTFCWKDRGVPVPAGEPVPILHADTFHGEPGSSSLRYAADACPRKPGTDVALVGSAHVPGGKTATTLDVGLRVGPVQCVLRVVGDRRWQRMMGLWRPTSPEAFRTLPLVYERAFGGMDLTHADAAKHSGEPRNPVGTGYCAHGDAKRLEGLSLPNLERPGSPITHWKDRPAPVGLGFIGRDWMPRQRFAGTHDAAWEQERSPLLPEDFDERFHNAAFPELVSPQHLQGGEPVRLLNVTPEGQAAFHLPRFHVEVEARFSELRARHTAVLDTVVLEPDSRRLLLTWRAAVPCTRRFLDIRCVDVHATPA